MSEMSPFEQRLITTFRLDRQVRVLLFREPDEPFVRSLERTARRVLDIMERQDLHSLAEPGEDVISNVQCDPEYGWVYSVRMQKHSQ